MQPCDEATTNDSFNKHTSVYTCGLWALHVEAIFHIVFYWLETFLRKVYTAKLLIKAVITSKIDGFQIWYRVMCRTFKEKNN